MKPFANAAVAKTFETYPPNMRRRLLALRDLILATAASTPGVGKLEETLKWGEPAYVTSQTKAGSTLRIAWKKSAPLHYAMYFNCQTNLVETFSTLFPKEFTFEGNRAIVFGESDQVPTDSLSFCIGAALTYHLNKHSKAAVVSTPNRLTYRDFDLPALYAALDAQRRVRGLSWAAATGEINARFRDVPGHKPIATSTIAGLRTKPLGEGDGILQMLLWLERTPESFVPGAPADAREERLRKLSTTQILRWDTKAIHAAVDVRKAAGRLSWNEVADRIGGCNASGLIRMAKGGRTALPFVLRVVQWLGEPAAKYTRASNG